MVPAVSGQPGGPGRCQHCRRARAGHVVYISVYVTVLSLPMLDRADELEDAGLPEAEAIERAARELMPAGRAVRSLCGACLARRTLGELMELGTSLAERAKEAAGG